jgi:hypothetical protein
MKEEMAPGMGLEPMSPETAVLSLKRYFETASVAAWIPRLAL